MKRMSLATFAIAVVSGLLFANTTQAAEKLELNKGDRITLIGNTLPERMQHDGWLEAYIQDRFADKELVFRNIAYGADGVNPKERLRVAGFGSPDQWLERTKADVVLAFFGFSESFKGDEGLDQYKKDLTAFVKNTLSKKYNGKSAPKLVLFSPIAHEDLKNVNLPDGKESNERLKKYAAATAEVANANGVMFVDLFAPTLAAYQSAKKPLTINGVHLNREGNRVLAGVISDALFGAAKDAPSTEQFEKLRSAVADKNSYWFRRYQVTDGYNVHGGRSGLSYPNGKGKPKISNRVVMDREMEILEAMTANRDKRVWAVAKGGDLTVDDSNLPKHIPVQTNLPGKGPGGSHVFASGEDAIKKMKVHEGMKVSLFASEKEFPELVNPVQMAFDTQGRLWVVAWKSYPHYKPGQGLVDKLLILEDTDGDGKADKCKTFADKLDSPTGFEFWNGGVIVACAPNLLFIKDTDGDDKADETTILLSGLSSGDTHHTANSFVLDPGGSLYFGEGTFHRTQVETPYGTLRNVDGCIWRYEPRTGKLTRFMPRSFANPHGHVYDKWGQGFLHDGTGAVPYHSTLYSGHFDYPAKVGGGPTLYNRRTRPCPATELLSSSHFPEEFQGNLLVQNVIGFQGILNYKFEDAGSSFTAKEAKPILFSPDRNFRPVDLEVGPDGSLFFTDWTNSIIGHMQHHIRDPNRDQDHGRVYRVTYEGRPLLKPAKVGNKKGEAQVPIADLIELLKSPEDRVRYRAKIELSSRDSKEVVAAVQKWAAGLDKKDKNYEHQRLEALWVHQHHNIVNEALLDEVLASPDYRARAAATRVLCYWRDRVKDPVGKLKTLCVDDHPRVRLEAVRACSFFKGEEGAAAADAALSSLDKPQDNYLKFTMKNTMNTLKKYLKK